MMQTHQEGRHQHLTFRPVAAALLALFVVVTSSIVATLLLDVSVRLHLRSIESPSNHRIGVVAWAAASGLLIAASGSAGLAWRRRVGHVRPVFPLLLAVLGPVLAVLGVASFYLPVAWPAWIDSELVGVIAIISGGMLSLALAPTFLADRRSRLRLIARSVLCLWGVVIVVAGTWAVLFLE